MLRLRAAAVEFAQEAIVPVRLALVSALFLGLFAGCTSLKRSDTARTGREQLLVSNAIDQSLSKVNFEPFRNRAVLLEEKYLDCVDKGYVTASVRHRLARAGARIATKIEDADILLEMRSGGVGTDVADSFLGTPAISVGVASIPEVKFMSRTNQTAVAKIGLAAYDAKTMQLLGDGGMSLAMSDDNNWNVFGVGPFQNGSVRTEIERGVPMQPGQTYAEVPMQVAFRQPNPAGRASLAAKKPPSPPEAPGKLQPAQAVGDATLVDE